LGWLVDPRTRLWAPAQITQREGRIERQGNENDEIEIYAYATKGSVDATSWQLLERKARFIDLAMSGDRSIRRLEDAGSQINQFAMAKAIASGDPRLMQKAGLEAELARLERMRAAHFDDQCAVRRAIHTAERTLASAETRIAQIEQDIAQRKPTRGDLFAMQVEGRSFAERKEAGAALLKAIRHREFEAKEGEWSLGAIGGFEITATASSQRGVKFALMELTLIKRPPIASPPIGSETANPSLTKPNTLKSCKSSTRSTPLSPPITPTARKRPPDPSALPRALTPRRLLASHPPRPSRPCFAKKSSPAKRRDNDIALQGHTHLSPKSDAASGGRTTPPSSTPFERSKPCSRANPGSPPRSTRSNAC
jgi:hypothetical protein